MENKSEPNREDDTKVLNIRDVPRKRTCPFYGGVIFIDIDSENCSNSRRIMEDKGGDSCALSEMVNMPNKLYCHMESIKNKPNWVECGFNTKENREKIGRNLDKIMVFPKECSKGVPLRNWMEAYGEDYY